ncbi:hypothetical protein V1T75_13725 [Tenacibaculum sp. FZY0031]|uniref:hypothetical protein n=1 Tax=Tenacibaculum sp. FZY0031 TaxID=3116648 RepID=UPI002EB66BE6|nr:hypothetical protein [Tenacibaculum sp. FZY0031]
MFGGIIEEIYKQLLGEKEEELLLLIPLIPRVLIIVLFDGDYKKAEEKFEEMEKASLNDEEIIHGFLQQFPVLELFKEVFEVIKKSYNISDFVHQLSKNEEKIISLFERVPKEQFLKLVKLYSENRVIIESHITDFFGLDIVEKEEVVKIFFKTTKQEIADEFNVNKRTFNKWLKELFGNRFDNRRIIYIHDYIEIFNTFIDDGKEYLELSDFNKIKKRLDKGTSFDKKRIAYLTNEGTSKDSSTLLKIQRENLGAIEFYKRMDKFPYSLTKKIVEKLGDELDF